MVDPKDQRFINISPETGESRITFAQLTWVCLVLAAVSVGVIKGGPLWLGAIITLIFIAPVVVWVFASKDEAVFTPLFDDLHISAWALIGLVAMALGGGALSPLTVVLVLGPLATLLLGRIDILPQVAILGLLAYAVTIIAGALGWTGLAPPAWQSFSAPLTVAALVQVVMFAVAIAAHLKAQQAGAAMEAGQIRAVPPERADTPNVDLKIGLPLLLVAVTPEGRIRRVEGDKHLRWPDLDALKIAETVFGALEDDEFTSPKGDVFSVLKAPLPDGGEWIGLVPTGTARVQIDELSASLSAALEQIEEKDAALAESKSALSDRTTFFAALGHDLKTPLNAILGFADLMKAEVRGPLPEAYKDYPAIIHESGQDLMLLVDDILDLAKAEASGHRLDLEPVDLIASGASIVRQMSDQADRSGVKLILKETDEVWAEADARAVRQIWQNLVSNAIKYSSEGGSVTLSAEKSAGAVALSVKDRGAGMSQDDLDRIATPFAQGDNAKGRAGTGLGLAVVHRFVELHGGKVVIDTAKGKGTLVRVTLPALDLARLDGLEDAAQ